MLSKSNRLTKSQFDEVFKKGRVFHSPLFVMRVFFGVARSGFSIVIPVKIEKTASGRNFSKRVGYNILRLLGTKVKKGSGIILVAKKSMKNVDKEIIIEDMKNLFVKSSFLE